MKKNVMIRIDSEIHKKAQELGINVSKTCENLLKIYLEGIEQVQNRIRQQTNKDFSFSRGFLFQKEKVEWTGRDLNPRPPDCESGVHTRLNYRPFSAFIIFIGRVEFRFSLLKTILMTKALRLWLTRIQLRVGY